MPTPRRMKRRMLSTQNRRLSPQQLLLRRNSNRHAPSRGRIRAGEHHDRDDRNHPHQRDPSDHPRIPHRSLSFTARSRRRWQVRRARASAASAAAKILRFIRQTSLPSTADTFARQSPDNWQIDVYKCGCPSYIRRRLGERSAADPRHLRAPASALRRTAPALRSLTPYQTLAPSRPSSHSTARKRVADEQRRAAVARLRASAACAWRRVLLLPQGSSEEARRLAAGLGDP
jgi:hypothetical protein